MENGKTSTIMPPGTHSEPGTLSNLPAASPAAPPAASEHRELLVGYTASPHTLRERMQFLIADAKRILANPTAFTPAERSWAADMLASAATRPASKVEV
jgi:hypothetical protein